ncbi:WD domain protein [Metarhizium album ARSEF 1941]|uniref:WD domain protein n=1 Tax=Metarhizium album (strain ARSEF 1941) TaxID=1081103 RepID=A0A0B2X4U9_METAS|nr:WD domain protein [Metarhizium album ARSEF 1941]KHO00316.1 WD domain protein [Metarhizium album ARSEF 1941]
MLPSSPPTMSSSPASPFLSPTRTGRRKEKRNPSVTPRRFGRFFTPRSNLPAENRAALASLNASATNRRPISPQSLVSDALESDPICPSSPTEALAQAQDNAGEKRKRVEHCRVVQKRRRALAAEGLVPPPLRLPLPGRSFHMSRDGEVQMVEARPDSGEGLDDKRRATLSHFFKASRSGSITGIGKKPFTAAPGLQSSELGTNLVNEGYRPRPIRKLQNRGFEAQLLDRDHGFASHPGKQYLSFPASDPRTLTASFYSKCHDTHHCTSLTGQGNTIPFSLASCHNAPVTVIGDEQGFLRLFNTTTADGPVESKVDAYIKVHDNAIMDLDLSTDDLRLATACGDRTGRIVDVVTQSVAVELSGGHWDSLRQIAFQPGVANGTALATSDRAGRVQIWDLRCSQVPSHCFSTANPNDGTRDTSIDPIAARTINTIDNAHERRVQGITSAASVTAIQWLPSGREHLLLSASEANASIKLWDIRCIKPRRQAEETPLAVAPQPASHAWRSYGITSLALSTDASRLYAVCKDSTVYAYSTSHLMLGHAPELDHFAPKRKPSGAEGLGPLYGFKHELFRASSFYVKCALRHRTPTNDHQHELLAVGSTDGCAVLFPTDERYLRASYAKHAHELERSTSAGALTPSQSLSANTPTSAAMGSSPSPVPIFRTGTPLVRGHSREVTTLNWSHDGKLVTASDDYFVRQWQTSEAQARHLRQVGEFGGERHMAGWADVDSAWDDDEA